MADNIRLRKFRAEKTAEASRGDAVNYQASKRPKRLEQQPAGAVNCDIASEDSAHEHEDYPDFPDGYINHADKLTKGDRISVWWDGEDKFYNATVKNKVGSRTRTEYDDETVEYHCLDLEVFHFREKSLDRLLRPLQGAADRKAQELFGDKSYFPRMFPSYVSHIRADDDIIVFRRLDETWHNGKIIGALDENHVVEYEGKRIEEVDLRREIFHFDKKAALRVYSMVLCTN